MQNLNLGPIIVRAASWPIETIEELHSPHLTENVDKWIRHEDIIFQEAESISASLYKLIPTLHDDSFRHKVLSLRRYIYRTTDPFPSSIIEPVIYSKEIPQYLKKEIHSHSNNRITLAVERSKLQLEYKVSLITERNELYRIAHDPLFQKAIYIASPETFKKFIKMEKNCEKEQLKKIDFTLYSYVMRSVGRATPNGLWAGVAMETPSDNSEPPIQVEWANSNQVLFTPNLSPFVKALRSMAHQNPWQEDIHLRLNPTLFQINPSLWQFENYVGIKWKSFQVTNHPVILAIINLFSKDSIKSPIEIQNCLIAQNIVPSRLEASEIINKLRDDGILWSTLQLPGIYDNPWHALESVINEVPSCEKTYWEKCLQELKRISCEMSQSFWQISLEDLQAYTVAARECVNMLLTRYKVPKEKTHVLVADMTIPFHFIISSNLRSQIKEVLRTYWDFDRYDLGEVETIVELQKEFGAWKQKEDFTYIEFIREKEAAKSGANYGSFKPVTFPPSELEKPFEKINLHALQGLNITPWEIIFQYITDASIRNRAEMAFNRWYQELEPHFANKCHNLSIVPNASNDSPLPPGSALILLGVKEQDCTFRIGSVTSDPCIFYSRFSPLFIGSNEREDQFIKWYRESIKEIEILFPQLQFMDLAVVVGRNPNAYSRPRTAKWIIEGPNPDGILQKVLIRVNVTERPIMFLSGQNLAIIPYFHSAIQPEGLDPYSKSLYYVSLLTGRPSLMWPLPYFSKEISQWNHLPRLYLDRKKVISSERWILPNSILEELRRTSGLERYITWRKFSRSAGLPSLIYGKYGQHQTEILIQIDSVIAIESLGRTLKAHLGPVLLREVFPSPKESWLRDINGRHYIAELVASWQGDLNFWRNFLAKASLH